MRMLPTLFRWKSFGLVPYRSTLRTISCDWTFIVFSSFKGKYLLHLILCLYSTDLLKRQGLFEHFIFSEVLWKVFCFAMLFIMFHLFWFFSFFFNFLKKFNEKKVKASLPVNFCFSSFWERASLSLKIDLRNVYSLRFIQPTNICFGIIRRFDTSELKRFPYLSPFHFRSNKTP